MRKLIDYKVKIHTNKKINNIIKKEIKKYYEFYGYLQFSNKLKKTLMKEIGNETDKDKIKNIEKRVIKEIYSNRLLIIDEVHNIRGENKETINYIEKVIKYSDNLKLIIMSATPMFNTSTEIVPLLNLLLLNDNRTPIKTEEIFIDDELTKEGEKIIERKSRGYISYLRGENPKTFPIRLYPEKGIKDTYSKNDMQGNILENRKMNTFKLYNNKMEGHQKEVYENIFKTYSSVQQIHEKQILTQASIFVYKSKRDDFDNIGDVGLRNQFKITNRKSGINIKYRDDNNKLDLKNQGKKIYNIIKSLKKSKGIIFIYSQYISSGIIPLAIALEEAGYSKYDGDILDKKYRGDLVDYKGDKKEDGKEFKKGNYIILSGDKKLSPNNNKMINLLKKEWNSGDNLNGEKIKIIIGSEVTSEGIDFQGIREIHILDPWYNLNRLEQVIGRGIRYCSHIKLPVEHRNVSIYLHISNINDEDACIDESIYQLAERKAINIGKIERVLKINSIDSYLFLKGNIITKGNISPIKLIDSRNNNLNAYYPYDREYSKLCSYMETCIYNPNISDTNLIKLEKLKEKDIDFDTFNIDLSSEITETVYKYIQELFKIDNIFTIDNIIDYINDNLNIHHKIIFLSLNYIIDKKITLYGINDIKGYIIYRNDYYIFQPEYIMMNIYLFIIDITLSIII